MVFTRLMDRKLNYSVQDVQVLEYLSKYDKEIFFVKQGSLYNITEIGLISGKTGRALTYFLRAKICNSLADMNIASSLIREVVEIVTENLDINDGFANGLAGIGWALEYLSQNNFIEVEFRDVLNKIDSKFFKAFRMEPKLSESNFRETEIIESIMKDTLGSTLLADGIIGYGLYFTYRVTNRGASDNELATLMHKETLIKIIDELEKRSYRHHFLLPKILRKRKFEKLDKGIGFAFGTLGILIFLCRVHKINIYNTKVDLILSRLWRQLMDQLNEGNFQKSKNIHSEQLWAAKVLILVARILNRPEWQEEASRLVDWFVRNQSDQFVYRMVGKSAEVEDPSLAVFSECMKQLVSSLIVGELAQNYKSKS